MTYSKRGVAAHLMTESIERLTKWLKSRGFDDRDAERGAVQIGLVLCGDFSRAEAREAAAEIAARKGKYHA